VAHKSLIGVFNSVKFLEFLNDNLMF
jgi:hypothetical protein